MCRQPPTLCIQPTPKYDDDDRDDAEPNLIGESGVEIGKLGDHQQPRGGTQLQTLLLLLPGLLVTSVFKCVDHRMVMVVLSVVVVVIVLAVALLVDVVVVVVTTVNVLLGILIVAELETQPDWGKSVLAALNQYHDGGADHHSGIKSGVGSQRNACYFLRHTVWNPFYRDKKWRISTFCDKTESHFNSLALSGLLWLALRLRLADLLTTPLLGSQNRCCALALYSALVMMEMAIK